MPYTPRTKPIQSIPNMRFGLNDRERPNEINILEMADCENWTIDEGTMTTAPGWKTADNATNSGPYYAIYQFRKSDGTQRLLRMRQNILEYSDGSDNWTACTMPQTGSPATAFAFTDGLYPTFATLNDIVVISNGTDSVLSSSDGITWAERATLPKGAVVINSSFNRVIYTAITRSSLIWWSDINDPLTVGASSWQYIEPNDGQFIKGATISPDGALLIWKSNSIYTISDVTANTVDRFLIAKGTRLASHQSIAVTDNSVIFAATDGVYEIIQSTLRKISGSIKNIGRNYVLNSTIFCAAYANSKYYLSMPDHDTSDSYNAQEYVYHKDLLREDPNQPYAVTRNQRNFGCYGVEDVAEDDGTRTINLYFGDSQSPSGSPLSGGSDFGKINIHQLTSAEGFTQGLNGSAQSAYFTTKFFTNNEAWYAKRFIKFFLQVETSTSFDITIGYRHDPFDTFTEASISFEATEMLWEYDNGETGQWSGGFGWSIGGTDNSDIDLESMLNDPRGIQFKISSSEIEFLQILEMAFSFIPKSKFNP